MGCCILTEPGDWENPKVADTQCQVDPQPGVNINKKVSFRRVGSFGSIPSSGLLPACQSLDEIKSCNFCWCWNRYWLDPDFWRYTGYCVSFLKQEDQIL